MSNTVIEFNNVGKQYILGTIGTGTLSQDLNRWWARVRGKEDPFLKIGDTNDRTQKGNSRFVWALRDINFKVEQGDVLGIIGKNGAGKSTLLKILSRVTSPTTGDIKVKGRIASLLEVGTGFHPEMTGRENIFMNGSIMGMNKAEIKSKFDEIVDFAGVAKYLETPVKRYASGMIVRLGFAIAAHLEPEILVVDEVLAVGDAEFQKKAIGKMQDISQGGGRTVLFVSHNLDSMLNLCKNGMLLENGKIKFTSNIRETVSEYINSNKSDTSFSQTEEEAQGILFISSMKLLGNKEQQRGLFAFDDGVKMEIKLQKKRGTTVDKDAVFSVQIMTINHTLICINEIHVGDFEGEKTFVLQYEPNVLLPNKYVVKIDAYIPNIKYYDRQETCVFTIYDTGTPFLKYPGTNNGFILMHPTITCE